MLKILKTKFKKNIEIFSLIFLIFFAAVSTSFFNYQKNQNNESYNDFIENIYFKKTLSFLVNNLEPKYQKVKHKIKTGETFDKILNNYSINDQEINKIKKSLKKKN